MAIGKAQRKGDLNNGGKNFSYHMAEEHRKSVGLSDNWRQGSEERQQGKKKKISYKHIVRHGEDSQYFIINCKWSITCKTCESLYCIPVTYIILYINKTSILKDNENFRGGPVVENPPCYIEDIGLIVSLERFHVLQGN